MNIASHILLNFSSRLHKRGKASKEFSTPTLRFVTNPSQMFNNLSSAETAIRPVDLDGEKRPR